MSISLLPERSTEMSVAQILQVIVIASDTLAEETVRGPDADRISGVVAILDMLEADLTAQVNGGGGGCA